MTEAIAFHLSDAHLQYNEGIEAWEYWDDWEGEWCGPYTTQADAQEGYERNIYYQEHGEYPVSK